MSKERFDNFAAQLGLRKEVASKLWEAGLTSPQQLGSMERLNLEKIVNDPLLLNVFHPILHDNVVAIATAGDPYQKAVEVIKSHANSKSGKKSTTASDSTTSDAIVHGVEGQAQDNQSQPVQPQPTADPVAIGGNNVISLTGNFVQSSIMSMNTTFHNQGANISASSVDQTPGQGILFPPGLRWVDGGDFSAQNFIFPTYDVNANRSRQQDDSMYKTNGKRRALLINIIKFDNSRIDRHGANKDSKNMKSLLQGLGFTVESAFDKRAAEIKTIVKDFATHADNMSVDMVAVYIGSHGERDEQGNDLFRGRDGSQVEFNDIKEMFSPTNSPHLRDKPKIFFAQFCRQDIAPPAVQGDSIGYGEDTRVMDMVCAFATAPGNEAYRRVTDGSWFVTSLCRVLSGHAQDDDLLSMLTKVNNSVSQLEGQQQDGGIAVQISEVVHNLRKKIFF